MCTDPDGNSLNYNKKAEVHNHDEQRRIHSITTRQKIQNCTKYTFRNERYRYSGTAKVQRKLRKTSS